ncbi:transposase [Thauera phenylacetica]|uniref:transposase n=1 Tax=Thauera phenylacetica TaxID=164400 RepID=UPI0035915BA7
MNTMKARCNRDSAQPALFTAIRWPKATIPRRAVLLKLLDAAVDWSALEEIARPFYQADVRRTGRKGYALGMMLRCHVLQLLWRMSDRQVEASILDSHAFAAFIGTDPWAPRPPSATSMRNFRNALEFHEVDIATSAAVLMEQRVSQSLRNAGFEFRPGRIEDPVFKRSTSSP